VPETLQYLGERHRLIMMTKGNPAEQTGKVERSGLREYFSAVEIVAEKDEPTYRSAIDKYALPVDSCWMVGNSPKSDVNPALAAGLHAVFIPHGNTWILEHHSSCWWWIVLVTCGNTFRSLRKKAFLSESRALSG
jgi:putative hydrolase of the HAD superfamily